MKLPYETIFSRTLGKINDLKEISLDQTDFLELYTERLHNVIGNPRVRRLFSSITLDDEIQEINFELNNSVDEDSDLDFVCKIFVLGMVIEWLSPRIDSLEYTLQFVGGKEEKMLNNPYKLLQARRDNAKKELSNAIRDYGYLYNSYINGGS